MVVKIMIGEIIKFFTSLFKAARDQEKAFRSLPSLYKMNEGTFCCFNLNKKMKVKLTDEGYQHLANIHNKWLDTLPEQEFRTRFYYKQKADKDGYSTFEGWRFIQQFGPVTGLGLKRFYDTNILFQK